MYGCIYMSCPEEANSQRQKVNLWLPRAGSRVEWGVTANGHGASLWDNKNIL